MKLYNVPRMTRFTIVGDTEKTKYLLDHLDGMYSYCTRCFDDEVVHISAFTEVELVDS